MRLNEVGAGPVASPSGSPYAGIAANVPSGIPTAEWATWGNPLTIWLRGVGEPEDADGDGYTTVDDCDDTDPTVHPFAGDTYGDGVDSDCDGMDCEAAYVGDV